MSLIIMLVKKNQIIYFSSVFPNSSYPLNLLHNTHGKYFSDLHIGNSNRIPSEENLTTNSHTEKDALMNGIVLGPLLDFLPGSILIALTETLGLCIMSLALQGTSKKERICIPF